MIRRCFLLLFLCSAFTPLLEGQSDEGRSDLDLDDVDPLFRSWGASTFIDIIRGPATTYEKAGREIPFQIEGFSYLTAAYRARINLAELFEDVALSSSLTPAVGASFFGTSAISKKASDPTAGYMHFNLPMLVHLEIGANATKNSNLKKFGLVAGIGYEFHVAPLFVNQSGVPAPLKNKKLNNTYLQPVYSLGIRYKRGGRLMEIGLKYGEGPGKFVNGREISSRTIRVMAFYFI